MAKSPTSRTNELLRKRGYKLFIAESYNAHTGRRRDLFGWIDVAALHLQKKETLGVQTTTKSNINARIKKAKKLTAFWTWLAVGNVAEFHGWYKKDGVWTLRLERFTWSF